MPLEFLLLEDATRVPVTCNILSKNYQKMKAQFIIPKTYEHISEISFMGAAYLENYKINEIVEYHCHILTVNLVNISCL